MTAPAQPVYTGAARMARAAGARIASAALGLGAEADPPTDPGSVVDDPIEVDVDVGTEVELDGGVVVDPGTDVEVELEVEVAPGSVVEVVDVAPGSVVEVEDVVVV